MRPLIEKNILNVASVENVYPHLAQAVTTSELWHHVLMFTAYTF